MSRVKESNAILAGYAKTRDLRDKVKAARDGCQCERHEMENQTGEACWKAARKWNRRGEDHYDEDRPDDEFWLDPPIDEWCTPCRNRQAFTSQLRAATQDHASAKRAVLARGRALNRQSAQPVVDLMDALRRALPREADNA